MTREEIEKEIEEKKCNIALRKGQIYDYEKELQDLQAQLNKCGKRWRAKEFDELGVNNFEKQGYYFLDEYGKICSRWDYYLEVDDYRYNTLNYHQTRKQAEAYKQAKLDVCEKECEIEEMSFEKFIDNQNSITGYRINITYDFETEKQADKFAEQLKMILNVRES